MFPCGCSLRSTQCAALIALATAAGVMRMDTNRAATQPAESGKQAVVDIRLEHRIEPSRYQVALQMLAPWLRVFGISIEQSRSGATIVVAAAPVDDHAADRGSLYFGAAAFADTPMVSAPKAVTAQPDFFAWVAPAPTARHHAIPFAVGPPAGETPSSNLRVIGTAVPGDRIARWMSVASIASPTFSTFARSVRALNRGQLLAGSNFPLSSALRGEPAITSANAAPSSLYPSALPYPALAIAGRSQSLHSLL